MRPPSKGRDVVCVGFAEWDTELWTNQHHVMARMTAEHRVLFVESLGLRRPQLGSSRDLKRIFKRLLTGLRPARAVATPYGTVHVLSPLVLPLHDKAWARRLNAWLLPRLVRRGAARAGLGPNPLLWGYVPQAEILLDALAPGLVVYHCVDDIAVQDGIDFDGFRAAEARFAGRADLVLASSEPLAERMRTLNQNVLYAPNVADTEAFSAALAPGRIDPELAALPTPRILFTGAISAKKLDLELLAEVARARPEWAIALVGPVGLGDPGTDVTALDAEPNVHLLGNRSYAELPDVLRGADAAVIPYRLTPLTFSVFPMKLYEYLAAGLPVVGTPLPSLDGVDGVCIAADAEGTIAALERELAADTPERRAERSARVAGHSWAERIVEIDAALALL